MVEIGEDQHARFAPDRIEREIFERPAIVEPGEVIALSPEADIRQRPGRHAHDYQHDGQQFERAQYDEIGAIDIRSAQLGKAHVEAKNRRDHDKSARFHRHHAHQNGEEGPIQPTFAAHLPYAIGKLAFDHREAAHHRGVSEQVGDFENGPGKSGDQQAESRAAPAPIAVGLAIDLAQRLGEADQRQRDQQRGARHVEQGPARQADRPDLERPDRDRPEQPGKRALAPHPGEQGRHAHDSRPEQHHVEGVYRDGEVGHGEGVPVKVCERELTRAASPPAPSDPLRCARRNAR